MNEKNSFAVVRYSRAQSGVIDELAGEIIDGRGIGLKLRPYEGEDETSIAAQ